MKIDDPVPPLYEPPPTAPPSAPSHLLRLLVSSNTPDSSTAPQPDPFLPTSFNPTDFFSFPETPGTSEPLDPSFFRSELSHIHHTLDQLSVNLPSIDTFYSNSPPTPSTKANSWRFDWPAPALVFHLRAVAPPQ